MLCIYLFDGWMQGLRFRIGQAIAFQTELSDPAMRKPERHVAPLHSTMDTFLVVKMTLKVGFVYCTEYVFRVVSC